MNQYSYRQDYTIYMRVGEGMTHLTLGWHVAQEIEQDSWYTTVSHWLEMRRINADH